MIRWLLTLRSVIKLNSKIIVTFTTKLNDNINENSKIYSLNFNQYKSHNVLVHFSRCCKLLLQVRGGIFISLNGLPVPAVFPSESHNQSHDDRFILQDISNWPTNLSFDSFTVNV